MTTQTATIRERATETEVGLACIATPLVLLNVFFVEWNHQGNLAEASGEHQQTKATAIGVRNSEWDSAEKCRQRIWRREADVKPDYRCDSSTAAGSCVVD